MGGLLWIFQMWYSPARTIVCQRFLWCEVVVAHFAKKLKNWNMWGLFVKDHNHNQVTLTFKNLFKDNCVNTFLTPLKLGQSDEMDNVNAPQTCMILGILWDETLKKHKIGALRPTFITGATFLQ